jgi:uncharacterized protein (TIGR03067 family)
MKAFAALLLLTGLLACQSLDGRAQEKKEGKKESQVESNARDKSASAPKLEGSYTLVSGKKGEMPLGLDAKKWAYTFTAEKITIKNPDNPAISFVMGYKLDPKPTPMHIDLEILEGPEGTKGSKAAGIFELSGETLKLAYTLEKDKRPKAFDGKDSNFFEFKKEK